MHHEIIDQGNRVASKYERPVRRRTSLAVWAAAATSAAAAVAAAPGSARGVTVTATDLDYAISFRSSNNVEFDFSTDTNWGAGRQRSTNGSADAGNLRSGRAFVDFPLDAPTITAAAGPGATVALQFAVDLVGQGVAGTPYTDGLDLRYLGRSAADRNATTLWNTAAVGADQSDVLATSAAAGTYSVVVTNPSVLADIAAGTPGQFVSFGFVNSVGTGNGTATPVGNSAAQMYAFQMNQAPANYRLTVIPEPTSVALLGMAAAGLLSARTRRRRIA